MWMGLGRVNVLHIGGSHVQAGFLSHRIRTRLSEMTPVCAGDRGMLFPYRAIPSNGPLDYRIEHTGQWRSTRNVSKTPLTALGLSGAALLTDDAAASLTLTLNEGRRWAFDTLLVIGEGATREVKAIVNQTSDTSAIITFAGLHKLYKPQPTTSRKRSKRRKAAPAPPPLDEAHFVLRGLLPISSGPGITYTASGINGASLPSWLGSLRFSEELSLLPPDLAILGVGINDANVPPSDFNPEQFKQDYRALIGKIRAVNPKCCLVFITNNDCWLSVGTRYRRIPNPNTELVRRAMTELAAEYDGALFDVFGLMGGLKSADAWIAEGLMQKDHIHFTREGYQLIGDLLYNALIEDYNRFNTPTTPIQRLNHSN